MSKYRGPGGNGYRGPRPLAPTRRREPDPKTLARDFFEESGERDVHNTAGIDAEAREPYTELVESHAWAIAMTTVFVPIIRKLKLALIHRFDLPDGDRQRNVGFLYFLHLALAELYRRADVPMPEELKREFN